MSAQGEPVSRKGVACLQLPAACRLRLPLPNSLHGMGRTLLARCCWPPKHNAAPNSAAKGANRKIQNTTADPKNKGGTKSKQKHMGKTKSRFVASQTSSFFHLSERRPNWTRPQSSSPSSLPPSDFQSNPSVTSPIRLCGVDWRLCASFRSILGRRVSGCPFTNEADEGGVKSKLGLA